ncbi:polysaccharide deacetylase family protein [Methylomagnum sp.]
MTILAPVYKLIGNALSPAGARARLSLLIYHRVLAETDPLSPNETTAARFDAEMALLKQVFNVLPLSEAVARLKAGSLPVRTACVTFDDGYADNLTLALPILKKHGLPACFFIASGYLNGGRMFNDTVIEAIRRAKSERLDLSGLGLGEHDISTPDAKAQAIGRILPKIKYLPLGQREDTAAELAAKVTDEALPNDLMMTTEQLQNLYESGMEIGAHTHLHPILAKLDEASARREISAGVEYLEQTLNTRIRVFAYPNGKPGVDYLPQQAGLIKALGFEGAVSTRWGAASAGSDPFQLPRFTPWSASLAKFHPQLLQNLARSYQSGNK